MMPGPGGFGGNFGRSCLLARRFVEAGVRFVEITMPGWDQHRNLKDDLTRNCTAIDKPIAGVAKTGLFAIGMMGVVSVLGAVGAGCLNRPVQPGEPTTKTNFTAVVKQAGIQPE